MLALKEENNVFKLIKTFKKFVFEGLERLRDLHVVSGGLGNWKCLEESTVVLKRCFVLLSTGTYDKQNGFFSEQDILVIVM